MTKDRTQRYIPRPPLQRGEERSEGGMLSLQRGNAVRSAISKQRVVCRVGANLSVRPFFVWCRVCPNANFANGRESTQITVFVIPNTSSCHSERSEESHPGKERRFFAYALNDKRPNAEEHPPPSKGEERKRSVGEKGIASRRRAVSLT